MPGDRPDLNALWAARRPATDHHATLWLAFDVDGFVSGAGPTEQAAWDSAVDAEVLAVLGDSDRPAAGTPAFDAEVASRAGKHRLAQVRIAPADVLAFAKALDVVEDRVLQLMDAAVRVGRDG